MISPPNPSASTSGVHSGPSLLSRSDSGFIDQRFNFRPASETCWGAILAGVSAAIALQVLFMMLGAGLGLGLYSPLTEENPIATLGVGAVLIQGISAVVSLWFGGWVAGRFVSDSSAPAWLHGFSVWCAATIAGVLFVSAGAGWALSDLSKLVGGGLSAAGQPAAAMATGAGDLAEDALRQSGDTLASFGEESLASRPADANAASTVRAKREVAFALGRFFKVDASGSAADRASLVQALVTHGGMSPAAAETAVVEWTAAYEQLRADLAKAKDAAAAKARELADEAASALAVFSLCAFVGFALGAVSASWGACHGVGCARRCATRNDDQENTHNREKRTDRATLVTGS